LEQSKASRQVGFAQGEQRGKKLGELKGRQDIVLKLLARQMGQLSTDLEEQVKTFRWWN
jgi:flagellar biosynthesis/type III secretory pathway protein FliH